VANVSTPGYSRQRADLVSGGGGPVPALFSGSLLTGDGVDVAGISRYRDQFLETRSLDERAATAQVSLQSRYFERIELVHTEPSDNGLAAGLDTLWSAFDELANHPGEIPQRTAVLEQAEATIDQVRFMDDQLRTLRTAAVGEANALVTQANDLATEIASLNDSLRPLLLSGASPNDLLDQRDIAVGRLTDLVGGRVQSRDDGTIDVYVGGSTIVAGGRTRELRAETVPDAALADVGVERLGFRFTGGGAVTPTGGEAAGLLEMANNAIPDSIRSLDGVVDTLVTSVNALHRAGQDLDGATAWNFFEPTGTTAATLAMSVDVTDQPRRISIATVGAGQLDAAIGQQLAALRDAAGGPDDQYVDLVGGLGVKVGSARARAAAQESVLRRVDEARLSARSVNIDEEMIDLVSAQRAYEASARMINAVDEMLDILVNRLGLVGR
jgi:flagellar hook-associated protein 1 FlgK